MEDTCFDGCRYRDKKGNYKKTCPDYIELTWQTDSGQAKVTHDCVRRRSLLMMMNWDQRLLGVQQAAEQERNASHDLVSKLGEIVEMAHHKRIESDDIITLLPE